MTFDLEHVYDEQIAPLMNEIIAICKEHQLPMLASFAYRRDENGEYDCCTTSIPGVNGQAPRSFAVASHIIYEPGTELEVAERR